MSDLRDLIYKIGFEIQDSSLSRAGRLQDDIDDNFKKMGKSTDDVNRKLSDSGKRVDDLKNKSLDLEGGIKKIGKAVAGAWATKKMIDFGKYAIGTFANFEQGMANVRATMGQISNYDFNKLQRAAIKGGSTTVYTATEASYALNYMALAGFKAEESIESLPVILDLAAAGNLDLARSSDIVTDAMSALSLEVKDLKTFSDQLAKTSQTTNTNIDQLGTAMIIAGGQAVDTGMDIQSLNTWLGILANSGYKGAKGGTGLRNVLLKLTSPLEKNAELLEDLGVDIADKSTGKIRNLNDILLDLRKELGKYTEAQQNAILASLGGAENVQALRIVLKGAGDDYEELKKDIEDSEDAAKNMSEIQRNTLKGAFKETGSAIEGMVISILNSESSLVGFKDTIRNIATELNKIIDSFGRVEEMKDNIDLINQKIQQNPTVSGGMRDDLEYYKRSIGEEENKRQEIIKEAKTNIWETIKKPVKTGARIGGAIAGAKLGSGIAPGIGTIIGAGIGSITPEIIKLGGFIKSKVTEEAEASNEELTGWANKIQEAQKALDNLRIPKFGNFGNIPNPTPHGIYNPITYKSLSNWGKNNVSQFATGTQNTPDTFIAGEEGPELITKAPNRRVFNNNETKNMFNALLNRDIDIPKTRKFDNDENKETKISIVNNMDFKISGANKSQIEIETELKKLMDDYFDTLASKLF